MRRDAHCPLVGKGTWYLRAGFFCFGSKAQPGNHPSELIARQLNLDIQVSVDFGTVPAAEDRGRCLLFDDRRDVDTSSRQQAGAPEYWHVRGLAGVKVSLPRC